MKKARDQFNLFFCWSILKVIMFKLTAPMLTIILNLFYVSTAHTVLTHIYSHSFWTNSRVSVVQMNLRCTLPWWSELIYISMSVKSLLWRFLLLFSPMTESELSSFSSYRVQKCRFRCWGSRTGTGWPLAPPGGDLNPGRGGSGVERM